MDEPGTSPAADDDDEVTADLDTVARALDALDADDLDTAEELATALVDPDDGEAPTTDR